MPRYLDSGPRTRSLPWLSGDISRPGAEGLDVLWEICDDSRKRASSLSQFNAIVISKLVNQFWDRSVVFVPLSRSISGIREPFLTLAESVFDATGSFPAWVVCPRCHGRCSVRTWSSASQTAAGECRRCGWTGYSSLQSGDPDLVPNVLLDNLTDWAIHRVAGGTAYSAALGHLGTSWSTARRMGLPSPPETIWHLSGPLGGTAEALDTSGNSDSPARRLVYSGRACLPYCVASLGFDGFESLLARNAQQEIPGSCPVGSGESLLRHPGEATTDGD